MTAAVVLVHGAWHGPWCWERVVRLLEGEGIATDAVELPGDGGYPGDLHADAGAVRRALDSAGRPSVVCGHSYGGAVITEAGTHPAAAHLAYVAAFAPDTGESLGSLLPAGDNRRIPARRGDDGLIHLRPEAAGALYHDCDPADVAAALPRLRPQQPAGFATPVTFAAWRSVPSTYAVCGDDRAIDPALQRSWAARMGAEVLEWPTGHCPMLCRPGVVAALLARLAGAAGG